MLFEVENSYLVYIDWFNHLKTFIRLILAFEFKRAFLESVFQSLIS